MKWCAEEFECADFGDSRLTKRFINIAQAILTRGLVQHATIAMSLDGIPLGIIDRKNGCERNYPALAVKTFERGL